MINGLQYIPDFLTEEQQNSILNEVDSRPWLNDLIRRVQHYGYKYDYTLKQIDHSLYVGELPPFAVEITEKLFENSIIKQLQCVELFRCFIIEFSSY